MELAVADWIVIAVFLGITLFIGLYFSKKAGQDMDSFFLGGRNLPWWIAGTSMVATTFAADTPLAVTELVANNGIAGNWVWRLSAVVMAYSILFFIGHLIFRNWTDAVTFGAISLAAFILLKKTSSKINIFADEEKKEIAA